MATRRKSIISGFAPDSSEDCYWEPWSIEATNDNFDPDVLIFNDDGSNKIGGAGVFNVPDDYVGAAKIIVVWTSTATSGNAVWDLDYLCTAGNDSENLDDAADQSDSVTDAAPTAALRRLEAEFTGLTAGNFVADDTCFFNLDLDGANASCTIGDKCVVVDIIFEYSDA